MVATARQVDLSPDGSKVVFVGPGPGPMRLGYVADLATGKSQPVIRSEDKADRLSWCKWASNSRLVCRYTANLTAPGVLAGFSRTISLNADGTDVKLIGNRSGYQSDGYIIDWLPAEDENVLMVRGGEVAKVNVRTLKSKAVDTVRASRVDYVTDGQGNVRLMGIAKTAVDGVYSVGESKYSYRTRDSRDWKPLTQSYVDDDDFQPIAIDAASDTLYALVKSDGRMALDALSLDGNLTQKRIAASPRVDIDEVVTLGEGRRVVGYSYAEEKRRIVYLDPQLKALAASLSKALPNLPIVDFVAASADERKLLLFAGSDRDPGHYYLFDKAQKELAEVFPVRPQLAGRTLAEVKPLTYKAGDGTDIPGYLTLPVGKAPKGLPAVVMPHGGPSSRDEWGFDWLAQFLAARGYAVIQPNYRGSAGYGDAWLKENGFKGWRTSIGDVNDAARYLASSGIADPNKIAIMGWSYGGYAALQAAKIEPSLYQAVVAVAPVTDLQMLKDEAREFSNMRQVAEFIGSGPHLTQGSPVNSADLIRVPVLLAHGDVDINVAISHSEKMNAALQRSGKQVEFLRFKGLDHQLDDSAARAMVLSKAGALLERTIGR